MEGCGEDAPKVALDIQNLLNNSNKDIIKKNKKKTVNSLSNLPTNHSLL